MKKTKLFKIGEYSSYPNIRATFHYGTGQPKLTIQCYEWVDRQGNVSKQSKYAFTCTQIEDMRFELEQHTTPYYADCVAAFFTRCLSAEHAQ
jgi:hypothetical protein